MAFHRIVDVRLYQLAFGVAHIADLLRRILWCHEMNARLAERCPQDEGEYLTRMHNSFDRRLWVHEG
jgi:hypothetical protein